jgi:L-alanine-DL-glutamate epimerase-like enolase superfamily enzyme
MKSTDIRVVAAQAYFLPVVMRVPLKFGPETVTEALCLRVCVEVETHQGKRAKGWGETPLSVSWVWPSSLSVGERLAAMKAISCDLAAELVRSNLSGHPIEIGADFIDGPLSQLTRRHNEGRESQHALPYLASLVAFSAYDIAVHDAYGQVHGADIYQLYGHEHLSRNLADFLHSEDAQISFQDRHPSDFLIHDAPKRLPVWHLVGGVDPLEQADLRGDEPADGYPLLLADWIKRDGLRCLKIKLRGNDAAWDYQRICKVGEIGLNLGVKWLSVDFNCTVRDPAYVNAIMDQLLRDEPELYARTLYIEQPFAYDLEAHPIDVRSVSARKPLFLDESAHDWHFVKLGRSLGWSGVALKTCKTQTGALLSLCWARAHGMPLMVQDLTNPMLAMIPHVRLAAHAGTIQGVECNAMQFYPQASLAEEKIHPGLFVRLHGEVDLSTLGGPGFGHRQDLIARQLPSPAITT